MDKKKKMEYDTRYIKENQRRIYINWLKSDFEANIEPEIRKLGMPISTFIKEAVREKIYRDINMGY